MKKDLSVCIKQGKAYYLAIVQSGIADCGIFCKCLKKMSKLEKVCGKICMKKYSNYLFYDEERSKRLHQVG